MEVIPPPEWQMVTALKMRWNSVQKQSGPTIPLMEFTKKCDTGWTEPVVFPKQERRAPHF